MRLCIVLLAFLFITNVLCASQKENNIFEGKQMKNNMQKHKRINSYKNVSTAPSFLKFKINDKAKNDSFIVVVENSDLAMLLAGTELSKGGFFKGPKMYMPENFREFVEGKYLKFLIENEGGTQAVSINEFPKNKKSKIEVADEELIKFLYANEVKNILSLDELGVSSEKELIYKCFDYNYEENYGHIKEVCKDYHLDLAMISLLIDLNYNVSRGDIAPVMTISKIKN